MNSVFGVLVRLTEAVCCCHLEEGIKAVLVFRATLFDYNGVLVDDEMLHLEAFRSTLLPMGVTLSETDYAERYLGFDDIGAFEAVLRDAGRPVTEELVAQLVQDKKPHYLRLAQSSLRAFPGAPELLGRQATRGPVVIVSGALRDEIEMGLTLLGATAAVRAIVAAEDTRRSKPDPEGYERGVALLEEMGVEAPRREAFVIEDSLSGVEAAKAARLPCLAVCHSYPAEQLSAAGADLTVPRLSDVSDEALWRLYEASRE